MTSNLFNCALCKKAMNLNRVVCNYCGHVNVLLGYRLSDQEAENAQSAVSIKKQDRAQYKQNKGDFDRGIEKLEGDRILLRELLVSNNKLTNKLKEQNELHKKLEQEYQEKTKKEENLKKELETLQKTATNILVDGIAINEKPISLKCQVNSNETVEVDVIFFDRYQLPAYLDSIQLIVGCSTHPIKSPLDVQLYISTQPLTFDKLAQNHKKRIEIPLSDIIPELYTHKLAMILNSHEESFVSIL